MWGGQEELITTSLKGSLKKELTLDKTLVAVGDFVWIDDRGQIAAIEPRYSALSRADNLHHRKQQILAANIDQVIICASVENPSLKPSLIDRYIIATERGGMHPIIVINKIDLPHDTSLVHELQTIYQAIDIPCLLVSALHNTGIDALAALLQGKASVFSGQSGVGKTSLINDLTGLSRRTGDIVRKTHKGAHTTTHAELLVLGDATFCIDTPGIKSFALWDITPQELSAYFSDIQTFAPNCRYKPCSHTHEPDCAVKKALEDGNLSPLRYDSYVSILENNDATKR